MAAPHDDEISPVAAVRAKGVGKRVQDAAFSFYEAITAGARTYAQIGQCQRAKH